MINDVDNVKKTQQTVHFDFYFFADIMKPVYLAIPSNPKRYVGIGDTKQCIFFVLCFCFFFSFFLQPLLKVYYIMDS